MKRSEVKLHEAQNFAPVFDRLRGILEKYSDKFAVAPNKPTHYGLEGNVGPATVQAWGGRMKQATIPVAWVEIKKNYVSYHLMGVYGNPKLLEGCSEELRRRMQGKSCFNFSAVDDATFEELSRLTGVSLASMVRGGFVLATARKQKK